MFARAHSGRRFVIGAAATGAIGAIAAATALAFAAPASAAPTIIVTPHSGLTNGQSVTVTLTFPANTSGINVVQCLAAGTGASDCDVNDAQLGKSVGTSGTVTFSMPVRATFTGLGASTPIDCTTQQCMIAANVGTSSNPNDSAQENISFAAATTSTSATPAPSTAATTAPSSAPSVTSTVAATGVAAGGNGGVPTGANTGKALTPGTLPLVAEVLGGIAVVLVAAGLLLQRRRR